MTITAPHILYVITEDWFFCSHFLPMARAAMRLGLRVSVATRIAAHQQRLEQEGIRVIPFAFNRGGRNPLEASATITKLALLYAQEKPDIIHHIALKPVIFGALAARFARRKNVINAVTGFGYLFTSTDPRLKHLQNMVRFLLWITLGRKGSITLLENGDDADTLIRQHITHRDRIVIVPGAGVDPHDYPPLPAPLQDDDGGITVGLAARMLWSKGIDIAVHAVEKLQAEGINIRLLLAGEPDPDNPGSVPEATLRAWGQQPGIKWLGRVSPIQTLWQQCDIALLPSRGGEGLPRSLIEAAACARPLISTNVPGCRDIVRTGENGILIPPNDPAPLVAALRILASDREKRLQMGTASRQIFESGFTEQIVTERIKGLYQQFMRRQEPLLPR